MKKLGFYFRDLIKKIGIIREWVYGEQPDLFWMPMFHFTQSFLTGLLQNYARQMDLEIDKLVFTFEF